MVLINEADVLLRRKECVKLVCNLVDFCEMDCSDVYRANPANCNSLPVKAERICGLITLITNWTRHIDETLLSRAQLPIYFSSRDETK